MVGWRSKLLLLVFLGAILSSANADVQSAQASSPTSGTKQGAAPVFKATTRPVIVNVVVTDKSNRPVSGLKPSDFKLWDSGKPQKLSAFEVHSYVPPKQINPIALPPHKYTNFTTVSSTTQSSPALNVVLFDLLNSPVLDRAVARKELLKFLTEAAAGPSHGVVYPREPDSRCTGVHRKLRCADCGCEAVARQHCAGAGRTSYAAAQRSRPPTPRGWIAEPLWPLPVWRRHSLKKTASTSVGAREPRSTPWERWVARSMDIPDARMCYGCPLTSRCG